MLGRSISITLLGAALAAAFIGIARVKRPCEAVIVEHADLLGPHFDAYCERHGLHVRAQFNDYDFTREQAKRWAQMALVKRHESQVTNGRS